MSTSIKSVFTAVTLSTGNNEEEDVVGSMLMHPLLMEEQDDEEQQQQQLQHQKPPPRPIDGTIVIISKPKKPTASSSPPPQQQQQYPSSCYARFIVLGVLTGFFIQVISLGAYAVLLFQYHNLYNQNGGNTGSTGDDSNNNMMSTMDVTTWWPALQKMHQGGGSVVVGGMEDVVGSSSSFTSSSSEEHNMMMNHPNQHYFYMLFNVNWFIYGILSILTQIDLVIYVLIWIAFTCTMTKNGMQFLRLQSQNPTLPRRWVFVLGVYFLVGIVLGAFGAWSMIDIYLGFPIPFLPIVATVGIDLILCYLMVWCYDLGRQGGTTSISNIICANTHPQDMDDDSDDDDDDDGQACVCC